MQGWIEHVWYGGGRGRYALLPLCWLYTAIVVVRRALYRTGLLRSHSMPVPVLIVGNLTVGGTGKTPLTIDWIGRLRELGANPGVVSRGYGGQVGEGPHLVADQDDASRIGDEPLLIHQRTGAPVVVGADRVAAARCLLGLGVDVIVSDDGLQHYRLARDRECVVIDGSRGLGNGWCLPAGPLREPARRLRAADLCVVNGDGFSRPGSVRFALRATQARNLRTGERRSLASFTGESIAAVAGIGNPQRFFRTLRDAGLAFELTPLPDHADAQAYRFLATCRATVLMTEKDAVKATLYANERCWSVPVEVEYAPGDAERVQSWLRDVKTGVAREGNRAR